MHDIRSLKMTINSLTYELSKLNHHKTLSDLVDTLSWSFKLKFKYGMYSELSDHEYKYLFNIAYQTGNIQLIMNIFMKYLARTITEINSKIVKSTHTYKLNHIPYFEANIAKSLKDEIVF